ncbi:hypothetical protein KIL84_017117, partial [Mauremys mutica]
MGDRPETQRRQLRRAAGARERVAPQPRPPLPSPERPGEPGGGHGSGAGIPQQQQRSAGGAGQHPPTLSPAKIVDLVALKSDDHAISIIKLLFIVPCISKQGSEKAYFWNPYNQ